MTTPRILLAALLLAGCATAPGAGFATLAGGQVAAPAVLGTGRLDEAGRWKTNNSFRLALDGGKIGVELREVALQAPGLVAAAGGAPVAFDPANPPPGYTFCHNTDCHTADGKVKTFDEVKAALAGGGGAAPGKTLAALKPTIARLDWPLTAAASWTLPGCEPHCFLPQGMVSKAVLNLARIAASGTVVPAAGGEPRPWTLDLPLAGSAFPADVAAEVGLAGPREVQLRGSFALTEELFDRLPWERLLTGAGAIDLDADKESAEAIAANVAKSKWTAELAITP